MREAEYAAYLQHVKDIVKFLRKDPNEVNMDKQECGYRTYQVYRAATTGDFTWEQLGTTEQELNELRARFGLDELQPAEERPIPEIRINGVKQVEKKSLIN